MKIPSEAARFLVVTDKVFSVYLRESEAVRCERKLEMSQKLPVVLIGEYESKCLVRFTPPT